MGEKEKHFFEIDSEYAKGTSHYKKMYDMCKDRGLTIDSTPVFSYSYVPRRFVATFPSDVLKRKKFILILREPVSREFSYFEHRLRACQDFVTGASKEWVDFAITACSKVLRRFNATDKVHVWDPISFKEYNKKGHVTHEDGYYLQHLRNWSKFIKRDHLFILNMRTLLYNTSDSMNRIQKFLGISQSWPTNSTLPMLNTSPESKPILDCSTFDDLKTRNNKHNEGLLRFIRDTQKWSKYEPYFPDFDDTRQKCVPVVMP